MVDGSRTLDLDVPRLEDRLDRLVGLEHVAQRSRTAGLLVPSQEEAEVVQVKRVQLERRRRQRHRRADLKEPAHPGVRQVDLHFLVRVFVGRRDFEAGRVDVELRRLVRADLLELVVQRRGVIDVGGAARELADVLELFVSGGQPPVGRLVLAEALEEDLVRMHGDHRIQHEPRVPILLVQVVEVPALSGVKRPHLALDVLVQRTELTLDCADLLTHVLRLRHHLDDLFLLLLFEPELVRVAVLGLPTEVGDHHVV